MGRSLGLPTLASVAPAGTEPQRQQTGTHASLVRGPCSPRGRRVAPDGGSEVGDKVGRLPHGGEQPAAVASALR
jgi:hypothetical protein